MWGRVGLILVAGGLSRVECLLDLGVADDGSHGPLRTRLLG